MAAKPLASPSRRLALLLLVLTGLLGLAHAAYWMVVADRLEAGFAAWAAQRRAEGWQVTHGPPRRGGWPLAARLEVPAPHLAHRTALLPGGVAWQAGQVTLQVVLRRPAWLELDLPGTHQLRLAGGDHAVTAERLAVLVPLRVDEPMVTTASAGGLRIETVAGQVLLRAADGSFATGPGAAALRLLAEDLLLPEAPGPGLAPVQATLGRRVTTLGLDLSWQPQLPSGSEAAARAWRDAGGRIELRALDVDWGPVQAQGRATLGLDAALQPAGTGLLRIAGAGAALDAANRAGVLAPGALLAARLGLALLGRPAGADGAGQVELPLSLQDRQLTAGRFALGRLPSWRW